MLPWVVLGILLAVGALVSVLYTSIQFMVNEKIITGVLCLIIGLIFVGELKNAMNLIKFLHITILNIFIIFYLQLFILICGLLCTVIFNN